VAVIGAGPIGLVAAAHLVARGETPLVLEAGDGWARASASGRTCGSSRRGSTWWTRRARAAGGGGVDGAGPGALPTGGELVERFLEPLAALPEIAPHLRLGRRVVAVSAGASTR
jgi:2-polyprenyl-6-methoxyphenol hydroxylase-like FAD-dependent oxidoreductase